MPASDICFLVRARRVSRSNVDFVGGLHDYNYESCAGFEPTFLRFAQCELNWAKCTAGFMVLRRILPTLSARDVRCRGLERHKCGTKRIMGEQPPNSSFARACVSDI